MVPQAGEVVKLAVHNVVKLSEERREERAYKSIVKGVSVANCIGMEEDKIPFAINLCNMGAGQ